GLGRPSQSPECPPTFVSAGRVIALNLQGTAGGADPLLSSPFQGPFQGEGPDRERLVLSFTGGSLPWQRSRDVKCDRPMGRARSSTTDSMAEPRALLGT